MVGKTSAILYIVVLLIAVVAVGEVVMHHQPAGTSSNSTLSSNLSYATYAVQLTDPPQVPNGTESLVIRYNDVRLHESGASNSTGFINLNASGSINLLNITNASETIALLRANSSESFDMVRFNITSAVITVNNVSYNVTVPSGSLSVRLSQHLSSKNGSSGVLISLSPVIVQIYTSNGTVFVMVPSVRAIVVGNSQIGRSAFSVGARERLNASVNSEFERSSGNISIEAASVSAVGNRTDISVTVRNDGNSTIDLKHVFLYGIFSANTPFSSSSTDIKIMGEPSFGEISGIGIHDLGVNLSAADYLLLNRSVTVGNTVVRVNSSNIAMIEAELGINGNTSIQELYSKLDISQSNNSYTNLFNHSVFARGINGSVMEDLHDFNISNQNVSEIIARARAFEDNYFNMLNFIVSNNGTLSLPYLNAAQGAEIEAEGPNGYALGAGNSTTLSFNSTIYLPRVRMDRIGVNSDLNANTSVGDANASAAILLRGALIEPIVNQTYSIRVIGTDGAYAHANLTAR
ncbi:MAG: hypothetical protein M1562_00015 [Candidatus Marsarchaeota archaeon]|nr:hypothetical protein [Candidatus Marsarchaeota archaeon]